MDNLNKVFLVIDTGGTTLKCNILDENGNRIKERNSIFPAVSSEGREVIINNFITAVYETLQDSFIPVSLLFSFPGPFDYEHGIPLLKGIGKYDSLYGIDFIKELRKHDERNIISDIPIVFMNDVEAFAKGEAGSNRELKGRTLHLVLGTGTGSAFTEGTKIVTSSNDIPPNGWIYSLPYRDSIIDDYLSARGFEQLAYETLGCRKTGKELQIDAENGNADAIEVFKKFSDEIENAVTPILLKFKADNLVLAGNLAAGIKFFKADFMKKADVKVFYEKETSNIIFRGLFDNYKEKYQNG